MNDWLIKNVGGIEARDYQINAWEKLRKHRGKGRKRALVHLATGLGKTSVAAVDVIRYREENPNARILFVSHMNDISKQARNTFLRVNPSFTTNIFRSEVKDVQVTFATFQALIRQLDNIDKDYFSYIIWDEAHHIEADTFSQVRHHFTPKFELALTATPERADGRDIFNYFGRPIFEKSLADGINDGWLSAVDYHIVFDEAIKDAMNNDFKIESIKQIRELFAIRSRNEVISKEVEQRRHEIGLDKAKTIVFCQNIAAAEEMAVLLGGEVYHSDVSADKREELMLRFKDGSLQVICTVDMFNEGIDIPDARLIVFLRSTSSKTVFDQQLGRGLRRAPGKDKVTVLDFVANVERINFVRELGRHVHNSYNKGGMSVNDGVTRINGPKDQVAENNFIVSNFDFEDKVIEIIDKYDAIKNIEYLTGDEVVARYKELGESIQKTADSFGVTWQAIKKHLEREGIATSTNLSKARSLDPTEVAAKYRELQSLNKVGKFFGVSPEIIRVRLIRAGEPIKPVNKKVYADEALIEAFNRLGSIRKAAEELGRGRHSCRVHLMNSGIDTAAKTIRRYFNEKEIADLYKKANGQIEKMAELDKQAEVSRGWIEIYKALDKHGFIKRPVTSAVAAAAYYKFGTTATAAKYLGVSPSLISNKSKKARYIKKYRIKEET